MKGSYIIMTAKEVAQYLRIPVRTLYKLSQERKIPATKVGRHWRFRKDLLDKWFDRNGGFAKRVGMGDESPKCQGEAGNERPGTMVSQHQFTYNSYPLRTTISIGIASFRPSNPQISLDLIAGADNALYQAKEAGRNRVVGLS